MELSIEKLENQLEQAKRNSQPVIVEQVKDDADEVVYVDHTHGTTRKDLRGGEPVKYEERWVLQPEVPIVDRPVEAAVGKLVKVTETDRTIKLVSGTKRTDHW